jgi:hypothetical protein
MKFCELITKTQPHSNEAESQYLTGHKQSIGKRWVKVEPLAGPPDHLLLEGDSHVVSP